MRLDHFGSTGIEPSGAATGVPTWGAGALKVAVSAKRAETGAMRREKPCDMSHVSYLSDVTIQ